ncbi:MAG: exodeoxyribonuclease III [Alphaproteobacteria bacterium]|nr:exodeoxyribonuclease III [Alphaproteobacteria bacterium]
MKIATYNVNSVNARLPNILKWLEKQKPDVVLLQEIKCEFNDFPFLEIQSLGYNIKVLGQKSYNGVAVLSRYKLKLIAENLPDFPDEQARYLEVEVSAEGENYRVASVYLPNGNPPYNNPDDDSRYKYKLNWMAALYKRAEYLLTLHNPVILGGDFNVILESDDVYNPEEYRNNALFRPEVRKRLWALQHIGYYDAFRVLHNSKIGYTFWDYAGGALHNDLGMRIDYLFLSAKAADKLISCEVDKLPRQSDKPSDHTALIAELR